uniref:WW domain-containing protein n=1 Tax=Rhizochromulina marina TaxID=1034831 RepID=A0A7S2S622_9STRA|mmetsp:Transcript_25649/g.74853  ORF Transcript_25649/g.74853 Transcript_25649/m.74853 type:complete len:281 (+) Transcript_25649:53-895(+)
MADQGREEAFFREQKEQQRRTEEAKLKAMDPEARERYLAQMEAERAHDENKSRHLKKTQTVFGAGAKQNLMMGGRGGRGGRAGRGRGGAGGRASTLTPAQSAPQSSAEATDRRGSSPPFLSNDKGATPAAASGAAAPSGAHIPASPSVSSSAAATPNGLSEGMAGLSMASKKAGDLVPLPPNWREITDDASSRVYYWNCCTGQTKWHRPHPQTLPEGWQEVKDPSSGRTYYWNVNSGERAWHEPSALPPHWEERYDNGLDQKCYYWNTETGMSSWDKPTQ